MTSTGVGGIKVHLVDGTYELFRHFFGRPPATAADGAEVGATRGVLQSMAMMLGDGATHVGVATDHVIESFRNDLWRGYKTGDGVAPELKSQFGLLEEALGALGVRVFAMVEVEADDALASAAKVADEDPRVDEVFICTPDKDLAQMVRGERVVQLDRRAGKVTDEAGVREKYGVAPGSIPDWLALVGDSADGFPGLAGWGKQSAATVLDHYGHLEQIPDLLADWDEALQRKVRGGAKLAATLAEERDRAMLFRVLATLRVDESLLSGVDDLYWRGPTEEVPKICKDLGESRLADRMRALADRRR
ncbi:MAG TPA: 5'-3' exonuclease H3TH domain-containing protein [Acidimicrobiales bacterium]|nr:5'-3' exonuclease H3TH domain-containing protein [Acidimicrobiales bacterium]